MTRVNFGRAFSPARAFRRVARSMVMPEVFQRMASGRELSGVSVLERVARSRTATSTGTALAQPAGPGPRSPRQFCPFVAAQNCCRPLAICARQSLRLAAFCARQK